MTVHPDRSSPPADVSPELRGLRGSHDRDYAAEGIPMLLVLVSETEPIPDPVEPVRADGAALAAAVDADRAALAPTRRDDDLGVTGGLLQARAYADVAVADRR